MHHYVHITSIHTYVVFMKDYGEVLDASSSEKNSTLNVKEIVKKINLSSRICKFYNEIMTFKHKLAHSVFNDATLSSNYTAKLTTLMIDLQTAAGILQNIKV